MLEAFLDAGAYREQADALYREIFWLIGDQLGTTRMIAERTGSLAGLKRHDYLPFGEEIAANIGARNVPHNAFGYVDDSNRMQFTGHERDEETGLDYMQARHYGSALGRFVSVDTVGGRGTDPQTLNLYAYVNNNPLRYTDPTGHSLADIGVLQTDNEYVARETERRVTAGWTRAMELGRFMSLLDKKLGTLGSGTSSRGPVAGATSQRVAEAQNKFKPLAETEVEIVDFKPPPDQEGYRLV